MKRLEWKQKRSQGNIKEKEAVPKTFTCNKCGEKGHFAKFCPTGGYHYIISYQYLRKVYLHEFKNHNKKKT